MRSQRRDQKSDHEFCYMEVMNEFHKGCLGGIEEVEVRLGSE